MVLLTLGGDGAVAIGRELEVAVPAPRRSRSSTRSARATRSPAAGWRYWAEHGLGRAELADSGAVVAATRFACHVAALTCARAGASPPRRSELEQAV